MILLTKNLQVYLKLTFLKILIQNVSVETRMEPYFSVIHEENKQVVYSIFEKYNSYGEYVFETNRQYITDIKLNITLNVGFVYANCN